jgi:hypothetical protein
VCVCETYSGVTLIVRILSKLVSLMIMFLSEAYSGVILMVRNVLKLVRVIIVFLSES